MCHHAKRSTLWHRVSSLGRISDMARWEPGAGDRLRDAALELYLERGYDAVTVNEIAERAGLTRRTFFRYFPDKREVLFAGSEQLPRAIAEAVRRVDDTADPVDTVLRALALVGTRMAEHARNTRDRRAVIAASSELQERERTKAAAVIRALADGLHERGVAGSTATLLAQVGFAVFQAAFDCYIDQDGRTDFQSCFDAATTTLRSAVAGEEASRRVPVQVLDQGTAGTMAFSGPSERTR